MPIRRIGEIQDMKIDIDNPKSLLRKSTGVTKRTIEYCLEAAILCLQKQGHNSPKQGKITGDWNEAMNISWEQRDQKKIRVLLGYF